jgi:hypothetical protein
VEQPVSGGIDISSFERLAQGTSVRNKLKRNASLLPQMGTGESDFSVDKINFDQSKPFEDGEPYSDRERVTSEKYLQDPTQFGDTIMVGDFHPIDGAIEPLIVRDDARFTLSQTPIGRSIKGALMDGNTDRFGKSDVKNSFFELSQTDAFDYFLDSSSIFADIVLPGASSDAERRINPFDDSGIHDKFLVSSENAEINSAILAMTGSVDDNFLRDNTKASTSGFIYSNKEGTDSLAFGGLLR